MKDRTLAIVSVGALASACALAYFSPPLPSASVPHPRSDYVHAYHICADAQDRKHIDRRSFKLDDCARALVRIHDETGDWEDSELPGDAPK